MDVFLFIASVDFAHNHLSHASSTAQRGGGRFKNKKPVGEVAVNHGGQSESTDGPKGGWSCVFWSGCNGCRGHLTTTAGCSVV